MSGRYACATTLFEPAGGLEPPTTCLPDRKHALGIPRSTRTNKFTYAAMALLVRSARDTKAPHSPRLSQPPPRHRPCDPPGAQARLRRAPGRANRESAPVRSCPFAPPAPCPPDRGPTFTPDESGRARQSPPPKPQVLPTPGLADDVIRQLAPPARGRRTNRPGRSSPWPQSAAPTPPAALPGASREVGATRPNATGARLCAESLLRRGGRANHAGPHQACLRGRVTARAEITGPP